MEKKSPGGRRPVKLILVKNLSLGNLTPAIIDTENESIHKNAQAIDDRIRYEDGVSVSVAVKFVENYSKDIRR